MDDRLAKAIEGGPMTMAEVDLLQQGCKRLIARVEELERDPIRLDWHRAGWEDAPTQVVSGR